MTATYFQPLSLEFIQDPYPILAQLRTEHPILWDDDLQMWFVSRYQDVQAILSDPRFSSADIPGEDQNPLWELQSRWIVAVDPPDHTRLRALVSKAFTPQAINRMHNQIVEITDRLLSQAKTQGKMDVVTDFASPLPISIITHMVGIPLSDHTFFVKLTDALVGGFDIAAPPEKTEQAIGAALQLRDYYSDLIKLKRQRPTDDLLSALILAEEMGDQLTHEELMATAVLLLLAGVETTANLITNGILSLLENPDQLELLKRHPEYIDSAVEEMLRYRSPLRATFRRPLQDLDYKGYRLGKGQTVVALIAAANRDAAVFPDPDKFDITRKNNKHLTFGYGIHYCLGAPLARLESKVAISKLFQTFPNLTLATPQVQWQPLVLMAGIQSLQVIF